MGACVWHHHHHYLHGKRCCPALRCLRTAMLGRRDKVKSQNLAQESSLQSLQRRRRKREKNPKKILAIPTARHLKMAWNQSLSGRNG